MRDLNVLAQQLPNSWPASRGHQSHTTVGAIKGRSRFMVFVLFSALIKPLAILTVVKEFLWSHAPEDGFKALEGAGPFDPSQLFPPRSRARPPIRRLFGAFVLESSSESVTRVSQGSHDGTHASRIEVPAHGRGSIRKGSPVIESGGRIS